MCDRSYRDLRPFLLVSFLVFASCGLCYADNAPQSAATAMKHWMFTSSQLSLVPDAGTSVSKRLVDLPSNNELHTLLNEADALLTEYESLVLALRDQNARLREELAECQRKSRNVNIFGGIGVGIAVSAAVVATIIAITK